MAGSLDVLVDDAADELRERREREREGAKEARRDALRGVAGALEEVREDLTVLGAKLEELRLAEGDEAEAGNADETRETDDADVDEK